MIFESILNVSILTLCPPVGTVLQCALFTLSAVLFWAILFDIDWGGSSRLCHFWSETLTDANLKGKILVSSVLPVTVVSKTASDHDCDRKDGGHCGLILTFSYPDDILNLVFDFLKCT